jgi:plasmid stabilization system protein ParE
MPRYQLTNAAEKDLEAILDFGIEQFSIDAAIEYYDQLVAKFNDISISPKQFPSREQIREGCRVCSHRSHDIYFFHSAEVVLIVRILNRQNIESAVQAAFDNS